MDMDSSQSLSNEIKQYLSILWRWAWLLVLLAANGGGLTYYYSSQQPKIYKATATVLIDNPQATSDLYYSVYFTDRLTQTYSQMIVQQPTLEGVIEELGLDLSVNQLQQTLVVEPIPDTQLLKISIEDTDPNRAATIVNSIGTIFAQTNAEMQASRYSETKNSLEAQMLSMDNQIQQTSQALELLEPEDQTNPQKDILQVQLETYQGIYQEILTRIVEAESETTIQATDAAITSTATIEGRMAFVENKISEISSKIDAMGYFPRGPEYEVLNTQLTAYKQLYQQLVGDFLSSEEGLPTGINTGDGESVESLSKQLEVTAQRILALTEEINATGGGSDGNIERDRLESNLALYRQTYAGLVQSYEEVRLAEIQNTTRVDLVQPASPPSIPIRPNVMQNALLGALVGLIVGVGVAFLLELVDDSIKGPYDIVHRMKLPILGYIPRMDEKADYPITALEPRSPLAESFRSLRTNIQYASIDRPIYSLMITSPTPQDGKSTIAANLGVVLAQGKHRVKLIDVDLRKPHQHRIFNLTNRNGLTDALIQNNYNVNGQFKPTRVENLSIMTTGDLPPNPAELVGSDRMIEFIRSLQNLSDLVLIDTPPVMAVTDPVVLSTKVDGVIIVVRPGLTKLNAAIHTADQLRQVGANILGVVLNDSENKGARYSQYYKGYYYQYGKYYDYIPDSKKKGLDVLRNKIKGKED
jgi:capsular exopolysaccharide synthesis family protein